MKGFLRLNDGFGDALIGAAAADVAAHQFANTLGIVSGMALGDKTDRAHDLARRAVAALQTVMGDEGRLHRMQIFALGKTFDRDDVRSVQAGGQGQAGIDAPAIHQHGAGAALAAIAPFLGARQPEPLTQEIEQRHARIVDRNGALLAVNGQADGEHWVLHAVFVLYGSGPPTGGSVQARQEVDAKLPVAEALRDLFSGMLVVIRREPPFFKGERRQVEMSAEMSQKARKPRTDSLRNRERLIDAATEIFSAGGPQASLEAVARKAGVGIATLYRHFPTREALFEAVYRHEVDLLVELAEASARIADPVEALRQWLQANVRLAATKKGMLEALQLAAHGSTELKAYSFRRLSDALGTLLDRAIAAGKIRSDISPDSLLQAFVGILYSSAASDWQPTALRLLDVVVDGLRKR